MGAFNAAYATAVTVGHVPKDIYELQLFPLTCERMDTLKNFINGVQVVVAAIKYVKRKMLVHMSRRPASEKFRAGLSGILSSHYLFPSVNCKIRSIPGIGTTDASCVKIKGQAGGCRGEITLRPEI
jgi:hypothetical protein